MIAYNNIEWELINISWITNIKISQNRNILSTMNSCGLIEGLWSELKYQAKHFYNTLPGKYNMEHYLYESLWKRYIKNVQ